MSGRPKLVQILRKCASSCGVERVPDTAPRDRVKSMVMATFNHESLDPQVQQEMEDAWNDYKNTFEDWRDAAEKSGEEEEEDSAGKGKKGE